jgi:hypothetical protein
MPMKRLVSLFIAITTPLCAAEKPITLWPDGAPGALGNTSASASR